jgi:HEAT repeat protein
MLLSALLLLGIQEESRWLGFSLTLAVLVLALAIRSSYATALLANLKENAIHFDRKLKTWMHKLGRREQKEAKKAILDALSSRDEELQLLACEGLLQLGDPATLPHALGAAQRLGTLSKIHFLRLLEATPFRDDSRAIETIDQWAASDSAELAKWANFYLAKRGLHHPEKIEGDIDHPDLMYRGAAILTLKKSVIAPVDDVALNRTIASKKLDLMLKSSHIDEISLGLEILAEDNSPEAAERALPFLSHEAVIVKRTAAKCLSRLASKQISRHTPRVIEALEEARDNPFRLYCLDALGKIGDSTTVRPLLLASVHFRPSERRRTEEALCQMGLKIVPLLLALTKEVSMPERARILAGKALGKLALAQLQANLIDIIDIEIERAYFYFYFGHTIQHRYPLYDLEMLKSALLTGYQSVIDFVIHLLGAAGSLEDPDLLVRALHSRNAKIHSHAVESLEKTCDPRLFRLIAPLVDDLPLEEKMSACLRWYGDFPELTLSELLAKLEQSPSLFDKIAAARLKSGLQMPNWRQELREQMKHSDEQFHQFAYELLDEAIKPD